MTATFEVISSKVVISDPCYDKISDPSTGSGFVLNLSLDALNGTWVATSEIHEGRVYNFMTHHKETDLSTLEWIEAGMACVDSGQAGVFDASHYRDDQVVGNTSISTYIHIDEPGDRWYAMCCEHNNETLPYGYVSHSGWGDGCYPVFVKKTTEGQVVAVMIIFIDEDDDESTSEEEEENSCDSTTDEEENCENEDSLTEEDEKHITLSMELLDALSIHMNDLSTAVGRRS